MKKLFAVLTVFLLISTTAFANGQAETSTKTNWPGSELRIIVPFKTGGALDVQARTIAQYLANELNTNVIVENVVGAGGILGTTQYLSEKPDTNVLLLTDAWLVTISPLISDTQYKLDDFSPVANHNTADFCLFANPTKTGIATYEDLLEYGKTHRVLFGSGGVGTSLYIVQKSLLDNLSIDCDTITQNGTSEGLTNLMAGTVDISMSSFKDAADYVKSGSIVPILWFGEDTYKDDDAYSNGVPCALEKQVNVSYQGYYYYSIRKGTSEEIINKLYDAFCKVYSNPEFQADATKLGFDPSDVHYSKINDYLTSFTKMAQENFTLK